MNKNNRKKKKGGGEGVVGNLNSAFFFANTMRMITDITLCRTIKTG